MEEEKEEEKEEETAFKTKTLSEIKEDHIEIIKAILLEQ